MRTLLGSAAGANSNLSRVLAVGLILFGLAYFSTPAAGGPRQLHWELELAPATLSPREFVEMLTGFYQEARETEPIEPHTKYYRIDSLHDPEGPLQYRALTLPALSLRFLAGWLYPTGQISSVFGASASEIESFQNLFELHNPESLHILLERVKTISKRRLSDTCREDATDLGETIEKAVESGSLNPLGRRCLSRLVRSVDLKSKKDLTLVFDTIYIASMVHHLEIGLNYPERSSNRYFYKQVEATFLKTAKLFRNFILDEVRRISPPRFEFRELRGILEHLAYSARLVLPVSLGVFLLGDGLTYPAEAIGPALATQGLLTWLMTQFGIADWANGLLNRWKEEQNAQLPRGHTNPAANNLSVAGLCSFISSGL